MVLAVDSEDALTVEDVVDLGRFMSMVSEPSIYVEVCDAGREVARDVHAAEHGSERRRYPLTRGIPRADW
jgi:hypothetical protein